MKPTVAAEFVAPFTPLCRYASYSVAAAAALCLAIPSGYSYAPALLFLCGLPILLIKRPRLGLERSDWLLITTLLFYFAASGVISAYHQLAGSSFEEPSRFLLIIPVLLYLLAYPPREEYWWGALVVGTLAGGSLALWQMLVEDRHRAGGFMNPIQFGNLSLLMGVLCLTGIGWARQQRNATYWYVALCFAAVAGAIASLVSGARGGWLALPVMLMLLYVSYRRYLPRRTLALALAVLAVGLTVMYLVPQTGVQARIDRAMEDVQDYSNGVRMNSSVGMRLEMWSAGTELAVQKPLLGWGESAYGQKLTGLIDDDRSRMIISHYTHVHSDALDVFLRRGLIGLFALLLVYAVPFTLFARKFIRGGAGDCYAAAGMILCSSIAIFGLTQAFFRHNSGVTVYLFYMVVLWAYLRAAERRTVASYVKRSGVAPLEPAPEAHRAG
ncbi:O-antigen ligase family protein [Gilvimarinus agarilyticus]|uniref:O-antigen ligase family protein n=1 Tax=Gilvimarinus agarilyticus TaxID=679259 RepID=UPI000698F66B|nr:O-antigen ligase family protein [Gilvimarinus agarilyticus]